MKYPAPEKAEFIQFVEQPDLHGKWTLDALGIPSAIFPVGIIDIVRANQRPWLIEPETAFKMTAARGLLIWRWMLLSCRHGGWLCASPTRKVLCLRGFGLSSAETLQSWRSGSSQDAWLKLSLGGCARHEGRCHKRLPPLFWNDRFLCALDQLGLG